MSICEKHRKFAEYWEELGKPQLDCKYKKGQWEKADGSHLLWTECFEYRISGDRHFSLRRKWVDSGKTLQIERNKYQTLTEWKIVNWPEWRQDYDYRIAGDRHWLLRKKWVDSGKTLPIEFTMDLRRGIWTLAYPSWNQELDYREAVEKTEIEEESPLQTQVGGSHYKDMKIQPAEYNHANGIGHLAGDAIAYISRYKSKNGRQDLEKAIHSLQLLIQMEYGE
jgi:hypothetical protein